ncbi:hypothetical protein KUCAC02_019226 [Chaenocephalus aceratus]|nr:hypothetical protein KUCAC02_019226 [Chaenocephalus aceratus]
MRCNHYIRSSDVSVYPTVSRNELHTHTHTSLNTSCMCVYPALIPVITLHSSGTTVTFTSSCFLYP